MRSKTERRIRHVSQLKTVRSQGVRASNRDRIVTDKTGQKLKEVKVNNRAYYIQLKNTK